MPWFAAGRTPAAQAYLSLSLAQGQIDKDNTFNRFGRAVFVVLF